MAGERGSGYREERVEDVENRSKRNPSCHDGRAETVVESSRRSSRKSELKFKEKSNPDVIDDKKG